MNGGRLRAMSALVSLFLLSACTLVYVEGSSNTITDSGNHSGSLSVPEHKAAQSESWRRPKEP